MFRMERGGTVENPSTNHISGIVLTVQFFVASLVLSIAAPFAFASEWQKLTQTRNHKVSVDMDALKR